MTKFVVLVSVLTLNLVIVLNWVVPGHPRASCGLQIQVGVTGRMAQVNSRMWFVCCG